MRKGIYFLIITAVLQSCSNENEPTIPKNDPSILIEGIDQEVFGDVTVNFLVEEVEVISSKVLINNDEVESAEGLIESFTFDSNNFPEGENTISLQLTTNTGEEFIEQKVFTVKNILFKSIGVARLPEGSKGYILISDKNNELVNITELTNNEPFQIRRWDNSEIKDLGVHYYRIRSNGYKAVKSTFGLVQSEILISEPDRSYHDYSILVTEDIADSVIYDGKVQITPVTVEGSTSYDKIFMVLYKGGVPFSLYLDLIVDEANEIVVTQEMVDTNVSSYQFEDINNFSLRYSTIEFNEDHVSYTVLKQKISSEGVIYYPGDGAAYQYFLEFKPQVPSDFSETFYRRRSADNVQQLSDQFSIFTSGYDYNESYPMSVMKPENNFAFRASTGIINNDIVYEWVAYDFGWDIKSFDMPIIPDSIDGFDMNEMFNDGNVSFKLQHIAVIDLKDTPRYIAPGSLDGVANWDVVTIKH